MTTCDDMYRCDGYRMARCGVVALHIGTGLSTSGRAATMPRGRTLSTSRAQAATLTYMRAHVYTSPRTYAHSAPVSAECRPGPVTYSAGRPRYAVAQMVPKRT